MILAMKMVHVTSEAKASPIMTALTRISAERNIDHGDSSLSPAAGDFRGFAVTSVEAVAVASDAGATGRNGAVAGAIGFCAAGAVCAAGLPAGCANAGAVSGATSDKIVSARTAPWLARKAVVFIPLSNADVT